MVATSQAPAFQFSAPGLKTRGADGAEVRLVVGLDEPTVGFAGARMVADPARPVAADGDLPRADDGLEGEARRRGAADQRLDLRAGRPVPDEGMLGQGVRDDPYLSGKHGRVAPVEAGCHVVEILAVDAVVREIGGLGTRHAREE